MAYSTIIKKKCKGEDLTGLVFGRITVLRLAEFDKSSLPKWEQKVSHWVCKCTCGKIKTIVGKYLTKGDTTSCGCHILETRYGKTRIAEYANWNGMMQRCYNPKSEKYKDYGQRGIIVCERWKNSFENFLADMGKKPTKKHTIDRFPNNDGNYEPSNCRWATQKEQQGNTRRSHWIEYNGQSMILQDWANFFKVDSSSLIEMIGKKKSFKDVYYYYTVIKPKRFIEFNGKNMIVADWARFFKVTPSTLQERLLKKQPFEIIYNFYKIKNGF